MGLAEKFPVIIAPDALAKIRFWVDISPIEVSGMGKVKFKDGAYYVSEVYLLEQENSSADTEIDPAALAKCQYETRDEEGHLNFWWHSHHTMGVFWSNTDYEAIEQIGKRGMVVATVFNKKRECRSAFYQGGDDFLPAIFVDELITTTGTYMKPAMATQLATEWKMKCKKKVHVPVNVGKEWCMVTRKWVDKGKAKPLNLSQTAGTTKKSTTQSQTNLKTTTTSLVTKTTTSDQHNYNEKRAAVTSIKARQDALDYTVPNRLTGMIHPMRSNLRWDTGREAFIPYALYCEDQGDKYGANILDSRKCRDFWIKEYCKEFEEAPLYDEEVDDFYLFTTGTHMLDFYLDLEEADKLDEIITNNQQEAAGGNR